jgi:hypothetical protein
VLPCTSTAGSTPGLRARTEGARMERAVLRKNHGRMCRTNRWGAFKDERIDPVARPPRVHIEASTVFTVSFTVEYRSPASASRGLVCVP